MGLVSRWDSEMQVAASFAMPQHQVLLISQWILRILYIFWTQVCYPATCLNMFFGSVCHFIHLKVSSEDQMCLIVPFFLNHSIMIIRKLWLTKNYVDFLPMFSCLSSIVSVFF